MKNEKKFFRFMKELNKISQKYGIYLKGKNMFLFSSDEKYVYKYDILTLKVSLEKRKRD